MSNPTNTAAPAQLSDHDLDHAAGGLLPAVRPAAANPVAVNPTAQPVLPAVQHGLIGLL